MASSSSEEVIKKNVNVVSSSSGKVKEKNVNVASSSSEEMKNKNVNVASCSSEGEQELSETKQLELDIPQSLADVIQKRSVMPQKLLRVEKRILKKEQLQAERFKFSPSEDIEGPAPTYPLNKPLPEELKISKEMPIQPEELAARVEALSKKLPEIEKAMKE